MVHSHSSNHPFFFRMLLPPSDLSDFNNLVTPIEVEAYDILKYRSGACKDSIKSGWVQGVCKKLFFCSPKSPSSLSHVWPGTPTAPHHPHSRSALRFFFCISQQNLKLKRLKYTIVYRTNVIVIYRLIHCV